VKVISVKFFLTLWALKSAVGHTHAVISQSY